jgi:hypothetical protein
VIKLIVQVLDDVLRLSRGESQVRRFPPPWTVEFQSLAVVVDLDELSAPIWSNLFRPQRFLSSIIPCDFTRDSKSFLLFFSAVTIRLCGQGVVMSTILNLGAKREWNDTLKEWKTPVYEKSPSSAPTTPPSETLVAKLASVQVEDENRDVPDLMVQGLVHRLPKPDSVWSLDDRAKWLRCAVCIFDLVYKATDGERREILMSLQSIAGAPAPQ